MVKNLEYVSSSETTRPHAQAYHSLRVCAFQPDKNLSGRLRMPCPNCAFLHAGLDVCI